MTLKSGFRLKETVGSGFRLTKDEPVNVENVKAAE